MPGILIQLRKKCKIEIQTERIDVPDGNEAKVCHLLQHLGNSPAILAVLEIKNPSSMKIYLPNGVRLDSNFPLNQLPQNTKDFPLIVKPKWVIGTNSGVFAMATTNTLLGIPLSKKRRFPQTALESSYFPQTALESSC